MHLSRTRHSTLLYAKWLIKCLQHHPLRRGRCKKHLDGRKTGFRGGLGVGGGVRGSWLPSPTYAIDRGCA